MKSFLCFYIVTIIMTSGAGVFDDVLDFKMYGMPKYDYSENYYSKGWMAKTDYCKYDYNEESINEFKNHEDFKMVKKEDIESIKGYFNDFANWITSQPFGKEYDFNTLQIKEGDYYCFIGVETVPPESDYKESKYYFYKLYYVDIEKQTMYFIDHNI